MSGTHNAARVRPKDQAQPEGALTGETRRVLEGLVADHVDLLYSVAMRFTRSPEAAETLVCDALSNALCHPDTLAPGAPVKPWLLTILRNTFIKASCEPGGRAAPSEAQGSGTGSYLDHSVSVSYFLDLKAISEFCFHREEARVLLV